MLCFPRYLGREQPVGARTGVGSCGKVQNHPPGSALGAARPSLPGGAASAAAGDRRGSRGRLGARAATLGTATAPRAVPLRASDSAGSLHLKDFVKD